MAYTDLVTFDDLTGADSDEAIVDDLSNRQSEAEEVIQDVTGLIEHAVGLGGRNQGIIAREYQQPFRKHDWSESDYDPGEYTAWADQRPVVELNLTSDDLSDVEIPSHTDQKLQLSTPDYGTATYFGGYRRDDHVLSNPGANENELPTGNGEALEGLSTLPPVLPREARMVATNIVLHVMQNRKANLGRRVQQGFGNQSITVEGADPNYVERQLSKLDGMPTKRVLI